MIDRFEFWMAIAALSVMLWSNHKHAEEAACALGAERACHTHFW